MLTLQMMLKMKTKADDCCNSCGSMAVVSGLSVAKKYRRAYLRKIRRKEYRKLKAVVPAVAHKEKVSKVRCGDICSFSFTVTIFNNNLI